MKCSAKVSAIHQAQNLSYLIFIQSKLANQRFYKMFLLACKRDLRLSATCIRGYEKFA